ncbi:MAG: 1-acyl-sn-glycerol-3-phosphate acyltransferase [Chloroflexi bacterium HGW-Chloroflexi-1]|nr:MAG: 1-acyl-sn-glycerol-3-phosphate acyltransferase [Chloroflexi bacterium HGW-Chloroflexi-1]
MKIATNAPLFYYLFQRIGWLLLRALTHLEVVGLAHVPPTGPLIVAPNHLHSLDIAVVGIVIPRWESVFAAEKWRGRFGGWLIQMATEAIYVERGEPDRGALAQALAVLKAGRALAVAPEGTRSRTGGLQQGKNGATYLASRSGAAILPVAVWGQERALGSWRRLRRPEIHVHIAESLRLPPEADHAHTAELQSYTDQLMMTLAHMLPPTYRGVYADRVENGG